jgi:hypothetical protein
MGEFGTDHSKPDTYDLLILNLYVQLDAMKRENAAQRARIVAHWEEFSVCPGLFLPRRDGLRGIMALAGGLRHPRCRRQDEIAACVAIIEEVIVEARGLVAEAQRLREQAHLLKDETVRLRDTQAPVVVHACIE